jgi:predicted metal-dependent hydrolase
MSASIQGAGGARNSELGTGYGAALPVAALSARQEAAQRLRRRLIAHIHRAHTHAKDAQIDLSLTDNQCTMISVRREPGRYRLRLHHMFAEAGPDIVAALGRYVIRAERSASAVLGEFITANQEQIERARPAPVPSLRAMPARSPRGSAQGYHHDLRRLFHRLNADYFGGTIRADITWGQRRRPTAHLRCHKSLQLGSYSVEDALIRIHPTLDRREVPEYYLAWIIYHEMLHQKHGIPIVAGRRRFHTPEFLAEERLFDDYERAHLWQQQNLRWLLLY